MSLKIYTDGGSRGNPGIAGGGIYITLDNKAVLKQSLCLGKKTNNEAEYLSFLAALLWLKKQNKKFGTEKFTDVEMFLDSKLVVEQINKQWKIKEPRLAKLAQKCWEIMDKLPYSFKISHVRRELNKHADELANVAMDLANQL